MTIPYTAILLVALIVTFFLLLPTSPYMQRMDWGYYPSGIVAVAVLALAILTLWGTPRRRLH